MVAWSKQVAYKHVDGKQKATNGVTMLYLSSTCLVHNLGNKSSLKETEMHYECNRLVEGVKKSTYQTEFWQIKPTCL